MPHHRKIVRDKYIGQTKISLQTLQQVDNLGLDRHVERRDGLVENQDVRIERQRPGDRNALPLPTREFRWPALPRVRRQSDMIEQLINA